MSENFHIHCPSCDERSESENHGKEKFVDILTSKLFDILRLADKNKVNIWELDANGWIINDDTLKFLKDHIDCQKLVIRSEYSTTPDIVVDVDVCPKFGCFCDLEPQIKPDDCVIDRGDFANCIYAKEGMKKEDCKYWRKID